MSLSNSSVTRATDVEGDEIATLQDADGDEIQVVAIAGDAGGQAGVAGNPVVVSSLHLEELLGQIIHNQELTNYYLGVIIGGDLNGD